METPILRGDLTAPAMGRHERPDADADERPHGGVVLACAHCAQRITSGAARREIAGAHRHTFTNPHGFHFHIGCFADTTGCFVHGEPTTFWTWFPGYAWQMENCGSCGAHLGWCFRSADDVFHGLVLDRLIEVDQD